MKTLTRIALTILCGIVAAATVLVAQNILMSDSIPNPYVENSTSYLVGWNGGTWSRLKTMSLANFATSQTFTSGVENGRLVVEKGARWSKVSTPAVSVLASASIAAESGVRHVADIVCFSAGSTTAPVLTQLTVNLRDGATGAGTIIHSWTVIIPAATGQNVPPYCTPPLQLTGTVNTAMTAEFSSLLANLFENVTLTGTNVF